jgi:hypothetical protein
MLITLNMMAITLTEIAILVSEMVITVTIIAIIVSKINVVDTLFEAAKLTAHIDQCQIRSVILFIS